jgi:hypothetical protein
MDDRAETRRSERKEKTNEITGREKKNTARVSNPKPQPYKPNPYHCTSDALDI